MVERALREAEWVDDCLLVTSWKPTNGYIKVSLHGRMVYLHRVLMEWHLGRDLDPNETVDHTCHNTDLACPGGSTCRHRRCIQVSHFEIVDQPTNWARGRLGGAATQRAKTHCPSGHPYAGDNLYLTPTGGRICRTCLRIAGRKYDKKRRASTGHQS